MTSAENPNTRELIHWLLARYPDTPKTRAKQWIQAGRVSVKGEILRKPQLQLPDPGDTLQLLERHATTLDCGKGWQIHPRVALLYLDSAMAVVNKGPGLISVPAPNAELSALSILQDFLAGRLKAIERSAAGKSLPPVYRGLQLLPVHRLDQYTSGVFCMACNPTARGKLIEQLKTHSMKREYVAYVEGRPEPRAGEWRNWLELSEDQMRQRIVAEARARAPQSTAQEAITEYEVMAEYKLAQTNVVISKLRLRLQTGRKHQIRAQAAHAGLPLVGDRTYHPGKRPGVVQSARIDFPRQALHAELLTLEHPDQPGKRMTFKADLPKDLRQLDHTLRSNRSVTAERGTSRPAAG